MKKLLALVIAILTITSTLSVASAANTTTLTTTVPAASYTLNIPADQEIPFGATETNIGNVTVTDASGFAVGKNLNVTITYDAFKCEGVSTTIPFEIKPSFHLDSLSGSGVYYPSGSIATFWGQADGGVREKIQTKSDSTTDIEGFWVLVNSEDWGKALAGEYTATITFTAEVVVEVAE